MEDKMSKIGLDITKENIGEYIGKTVLVYLKPKMPVQESKKKGFHLDVNFSWDKRPTGYSGYSGYSANSGFRYGELEQIEEMKFVRLSKSKECILTEKRDWDWEGKERIQRHWYTVDSVLDANYFIEILE
jgi:hypothetical protein